MSLIVLGALWLAGIYLGTSGVLPAEFAIGLAFAVSALLALWWSSTKVRLSVLAAIVLLAAVGRGQASLPDAGPQSLLQYNDRGALSVRGVVADDPTSKLNTSSLRLAVGAVKPEGSDSWRPASGNVAVRLAREPARRYGDYLELYGSIETPPNFDLFSYRDYLALQGVSGQMQYPKVVLLAEDHAWKGYAVLHEVRASWSAALASALPEPQAALAQGILLGERSQIPPDLTAAFRNTNTTHIVAISGTNVSLVAALLFMVGSKLFRRRGATILAVLAITAYAIMVGLSPSVLRATVMGICYILGAHVGRPRDATAGLVIAAVVMTLLNPLVLFDLGFQLSFLATAGLVLLSKPLEVRLGRLPGWLASLLAVAIAAEIATLPLVLLRTGQFSLVGPLANLVVPPLLPPVMLSSAATILGSLLSPGLGQVAGYAAWLFLSLMISAVQILSAIPIAVAPTGTLGTSFVVAYYALLAGLLLARLRPTQWCQVILREFWARVPLKYALGTLGVALAIVWSAVLTIPDETLRITVLDVGQGDAILVRQAQYKILIDGGPDPERLANALGRRLPFWDRGLDVVILTHPNDDHLAGLLGVLERFPVMQVLETDARPNTATYLRWEELIQMRGIKRGLARSGQEIDLGKDARLSILHPSQPSLPADDLNNQSIVMRLSAGGFSALFTGDIASARAGEMLAAGEELESTMLKVPHHGSRTGLDRPLLEAISPEVAVISVGQGNRFGHPAPEIMALLRERGIRVYRTDVNGSTEVIVDRDGYTVRTER